MKRIYATFTLLAFAGSAVAAPKGVPVKALKPLVLSYLQATGCADDDIDAKSITKFSDPANKLDGYVVIANTDAGCAGGSGTSGSTMVVVRTAEGQEGVGDDDLSYLKVDVAMSEPSARSTGMPRAVTGVYQEKGQLYATGLDYGKNDGNCCPSIKTLYRVKLMRKDLTVSKDDVRPTFTWEFIPTKK